MKQILYIICLLFIGIIAKAAKADPTPVTIVQPNGQQLTIVQHGDEHFSWITALDGTLLKQIGKAYYIATVERNGALTATHILANEINKRTATEKRLIEAQQKNIFYQNIPIQTHQHKHMLPLGQHNPPYFPHSGSPKVLTILVQFADTTFSVTNPAQSFNDYLNHEGQPLPQYDHAESRNHGSVKQYFKDMSNGAFQPQFDVVGPITLPQKLAFYGADQHGIKDFNIEKLIEDACKKIDQETDFTQYDSNNDGIIDLVYIIYAGYSQSVTGNSSDAIWPKSSAFYGKNITFDGLKIGRYGVSNELNYTPTYKLKALPNKRINGIGLFCHEFSHTMGLPDFYQVSPDAITNNQTMEFWDVMDAGTYTDNGYTPTPYTPWEKELFGWTTIPTLEDTPAQITLQPHQTYRIHSKTNNEYIILHNIRKENWGKKLLGEGMLIYRVDYKHDEVNLWNHVNDQAGQPGMTIVPADGIIINSSTQDSEQIKVYKDSHAGDPYPGTTQCTEILSIQLNNSTIDHPIYNIEEDKATGNITFDFIENFATAIDTYKQDTTKDNTSIYTTDGRYIGENSDNLPKGIYIRNKKKYVKI